MRNANKLSSILLSVRCSQIVYQYSQTRALPPQAEAEPHSSVGSVADLRTRDRWFDPRFGKYSFRELMIVVATGVIPLSPLSVVLTMVMWENSQWLGKNIVRSTG